jgi:hypothetical protein
VVGELELLFDQLVVGEHLARVFLLLRLLRRNAQFVWRGVGLD